MAGLFHLVRIGWNGARPIFLRLAGKLMTSCCCGSSSSSGSSSNPSGSSSSGPIPWPGTGWYCVKYWSGDCTIPYMICQIAQCTEITTQAQWDSYGFGTCTATPGPDVMWTTDGIKHADNGTCESAGCACP